MMCRQGLLTLLAATLLGSPLPAAVSWQFDGTAVPNGAGVKLLSGKPAFVATDEGQGLAPGVALQYADMPELRLRPELEIRCRFRLDELPEHPRAILMKNGEYLLRTDGTRDGGYLSFYVQIEGRWEPRLRGPVVQAGTWYEVSAAWSGQNMRMTVNGERFEQTRFGRISSGAEPIQIGPFPGVIDHVELRNPSLKRTVFLSEVSANSRSRDAASPTAVSAAPVAADKPFWAGRGEWDGWQPMNGATCNMGGGTMTAAFPEGSSMIVSPWLACDLAPRPFICLDLEAVAPGSTGYIDFVTDAGVDSISFQPQSDGRPTIIDGAMSEAWTGTLRRLALRFSGGEGPVVIRQLAVTDRPVGTPVLYIRSLAAGRAKLRSTREETVVAGIQNVGGEAESITARLTVPEGVEILGRQEQAIPYLGMDDFDMVTWRIRAAKPGTYAARLEVATTGAKTQSKEVALVVEPQPDLPAADYVPEPQPAKTDYINLMHYCALWKEGTHYGWQKIEPWPEKRPAIGWYDEGTPEVADWHIKYAVEHGITGFIYCWYRAHYEPEIEHTLGHAIHDGLFDAKYRDMFTFTIMWENGCAKGVKDEADLLDNVLPFWIKNYFTHPSYLKIDNRPILFVWQPRVLIPELGGPEKTKQAFEKMRAQCREAGFDGLRIIACLDNPHDATLAKQIQESGWDAVSGYNLSIRDVKPAGLDPAGLAFRNHAEVLGRYKQAWLDRDALTGDMPDIPNVVMGRDDRPWGRVKRGKGDYIANPCADNFEAACRDAKELVDAKPAGRWDSKIVVFDNWTEFGEGHYIEPTTGTGFSFVNAIKRVFCTGWAPEAVTEIIPEDVGLPAPQRRYEETRAAFGDRMPWQPIRIVGDLVAHWEFETEEDGRFADSSVNDCRLTGEGVSLEPGRGGMVLRCGDGGAFAPAPAPFFHPGGVTVALWCKPSEANQSDRWMLNTVGGGTTGYRLGLGDGHPYWQVPRESWSHGLRGPKRLPVDQWSHVAATFDNRTMRLYVNGEEVASQERRGFINPGDAITVGAFNAAMDRARFRGWLDGVRVYRRVLTPDEIATLARE